eukprot:1361075-Prymnesium_polylepis.1
MSSAAQPVQRDRRILKKVDQLGVLLAFLEQVIGARVAKQRQFARPVALANEPVEVLPAQVLFAG